MCPAIPKGFLTQLSPRAGHITDFGKLPRHELYSHYWILDWQDHEGWNEQRPANQ